MQNKPDENLFREVHRRVQDLRNRAHKDRNEAARETERTDEDEVKNEGFDGPGASPPSKDDSE